MPYFEFYVTIAAFISGVVILGLLFWALIDQKMTAQRKYINDLNLEAHRTYKKGAVVPIEEMIEEVEENIWIVTGDHPQLGRPDKGGLTDWSSKLYAQELQQLGYENIQFIKQN